MPEKRLFLIPNFDLNTRMIFDSTYDVIMQQHTYELAPVYFP